MFTLKCYSNPSAGVSDGSLVLYEANRPYIERRKDETIIRFDRPDKPTPDRGWNTCIILSLKEDKGKYFQKVIIENQAGKTSEVVWPPSLPS